MLSFRAISLFFVASLASLSFTLAAPQYRAPTGVRYEGVPAGCDVTCMAKSYPVPVILNDMVAKFPSLLAKIHDLPEVKAETLKPIASDMTRTLNSGTVKVKAYVDKKIDLSVALASDAHGGAAVTLEVLVRTFVSLVASVVFCIKAALNATSKAELVAVTKIFASICVSLALFLEVCCQLVVGLAAELAAQLTTFISLCADLSISASIGFLTKQVA